MKNLIYCSNAQKDIFEFNTRSRFENYIDIDNLEYLPDGDIEVGVKKIIFDTDTTINYEKSLIFFNERTTENPVYALKSSICKESIFNGVYDKILCIFQSENIFHVTFKNPTFFPTKKELLSNAKFNIINLKTGEHPKWDEGSPTFIHLIIRKRMSETFNIFVESNDVKSMEMFKENNNMEFTIDLPERFRLDDWKVCLKSVVMPSRVWNVYDETMPSWTFVSTNSSLERQGYTNTIPQGSYKIVDIIILIQYRFDKLKIPIIISLNNKNRVNLKLKWKHVAKEDSISIYFNEYLTKMLGFRDKSKVLGFTRKSNTYVAPYEPNVHAYTPKSIIVTCDIVEDTIFGGERLKLLRLITNKLERIGDTIKYDFLHDEYVDLRTREFERIKLRISDVTGGLLKVDYGEIETRIQLEFKKKS